MGADAVRHELGCWELGLDCDAAIEPVCRVAAPLLPVAPDALRAWFEAGGGDELVLGDARVRRDAAFGHIAVRPAAGVELFLQDDAVVRRQLQACCAPAPGAPAPRLEPPPAGAATPLQWVVVKQRLAGRRQHGGEASRHLAQTVPQHRRVHEIAALELRADRPVDLTAPHWNADAHADAHADAQ
jgi:hypothetical protein